MKLAIYKVIEEVYTHIKQSLCISETGGILGVNVHDEYTVTEFYYDSTGKTETNVYVPDIEVLNSIISGWAERNIKFIGFVHSHPKNHYKLSGPDIEYANRIKKSCEIDQILMMIYLPDSQELYQYVV